MTDTGLFVLGVCGVVAAACIATSSAWPLVFLVILAAAIG